MNYSNFFIIILVIFFKNGHSLKCHVCNSKLSTDCQDPFNVSETLQECERGPGGRFGSGGRLLDVVDIIMQTGIDNVVSQAPEGDKPGEVFPDMVCQKIVVIVGNESITGRGCSPQSVDGMHPCDAVRFSAPGNVRHCVTCPTDACNAAPGVAMSPRDVAIATIVVSIAAVMLGR